MAITDPVERAKAMLSTIALARSKGISQAYPDASVANVLSALVGEVEKLRAVIIDGTVADYKREHNLT